MAAMREIPAAELRGVDGLEMITYNPADPPDPPPPVRVFAGLPEPLEVPYARASGDVAGLANLWRAIAAI